MTRMSIATTSLIMSRTSSHSSVDTKRGRPTKILTRADPPTTPLAPRQLPPLLNSRQLRTRTSPAIPLTRSRPAPSRSAPRTTSSRSRPLVQVAIAKRVLSRPIFAPFQHRNAIQRSDRPICIVSQRRVRTRKTHAMGRTLHCLPKLLDRDADNKRLKTRDKRFVQKNDSSRALVLLSNHPLGRIKNFKSFSLSALAISTVRRVRILPKNNSILCNSDTVNNIVGVVAQQPKRRALRASTSTTINDFNFGGRVLRTQNDSNKAD